MENIKDIYPLSPMQQGMLFHTLLAPETEAYTEQMSCILRGPLDQAAFQHAWQQVMDRHDILRSAFIYEDVEQPLQVVHEQLEVPFEVLSWGELDEINARDKFKSYLQNKRAQGFELTDAPLLSLSLAKIDGNTHFFGLHYHHILMDGWSMPLMLGEVFHLYDAYSKDRPVSLDTPRPFADYISWIQQQDKQASLDFWKEKLAGFYAPTPLGVDKPNASGDDGYAIEHFNFPEDFSQQLDAFARGQKLTINTLVQGAWAVLLSRYSRQEDVLFGATVSGRPAEIPGIETMVGLFINTLPVRVTFDKSTTVIDMLNRLQQEQAQVRQFEYSALVDIQGVSEVPRDQPLFNSLLVYENYPVDETMKQQKSELSVDDVAVFERSNYPLTVVSSFGKILGLALAYETARFSPDTIQRIAQHMKNILHTFLESPQAKIEKLNFLSPEEKNTVLYDWNDTGAPFNGDQTTASLFSHAVQKFPEKTALVDSDGDTLTYAQLDEKSDALASFLQNKGIAVEEPVVICLGRYREMVVATLAVLKAGAAYVPIDPVYPDERIEYIINDCGAKWVISDSKLKSRLSAFEDKLILPEEIKLEKVKPEPVALDPWNMAYIIYTSGSTGKPKGVMLRHGGLINTVEAQQKDFHVNEESCVLQFASYSFDASVCEIFLALFSGAQLHLIQRETILSEAEFTRYLNERQITTVTMPPSLLSLLADSDLPHLQTVVSVGEACSNELANKWYKKTRFVNGYGPTEATIGCVWGQISAQDSGFYSAPIGKPIQNDRIYILDHQLQAVPIGVAGELCIASVGLARGYLHRPDLTAEKFIPNPFDTDQGSRLYKSGDLARWLPDGNIEFIGRIDFQVKIRGNRIELGEIEAILTKQQAVRDAVVLAVGERVENRYLAAYIIPNAAEIDLENLKSNLRNELPEYMMPIAYLLMDSFPLTSNGKVNRRALPLPEEENLTLAARAYVAPRNPEEELLSVIFQDILNVERVGIHDSFFDLGGHSLLATQMVSRVRDAFGVEVPLRLLFSGPTIAEIAPQIKALSAGEDANAIPAPAPMSREGDIPLSFSQKRLWFLDQLQPGSNAYNIPVALKLSGPLNSAALKRSIHFLVKRHEVLRTVFADKNGEPVQVILPELQIEIKEKDLSAIESLAREESLRESIKKEAALPFNLASGPLLRIGLIKLAEQEHVLLFTIHHIVSDGWSMGIMINEVSTAYSAFACDMQPELPALPIQYADYALWQDKEIRGPVLEKQLDYWKQKLGNNPAPLELPFDHPRPAVQTFNGDSVTIELPPELSRAMRELSNHFGVTPFMAYSALFQALLHRYSGQDDILIGTPVANRSYSVCEPLIGFFVNNLVLKTSFEADPIVEDLLVQARENILEAYTHQDAPFEQIVDAVVQKRDMSHSPLFQVMFVFQNLPEGKINSADLTLESLEDESANSKFDLSVTLAETTKSMAMQFEFNSDLFERSTIERMTTHFTNFICEASGDTEQRISEIDYLPAEERDALLHQWNRTESPFEEELTVHERFARQAMAAPQNAAVRFKNMDLSYAELDRRSEQVALQLLHKGLQAEDRVGICLEPSFEMVVAMLAAVKAGGAFLPLDPGYPAERLKYMVADSAMRFILTRTAEENTARAISGEGNVDILVLDRNDGPAINGKLPWIDPQGLAYVIYTSGSTGKPKGTLLAHRGLVNLAELQRRAFHIDGQSRILQFSSLSFDAAVWETVMALLNGATLCLVDRAIRSSGDALTDFMAEQKISTVTLPPSVLSIFPDRELPELKTIITAGEKCTPNLVKKWAPGRDFFNAYGPTETTVCASMFKTDPKSNSAPPIGRANPNFQLYVLDRFGYPVPYGVPGELCVWGVGLARGYHQRAGLTAEKFIPNAFSSIPGARLYRTGDLVRMLPDGNIDFLGRIDHQVKVRGFRIELGEIESALSSLPVVEDCIVLARKNPAGEDMLVAWYTVSEEVDVKTLRDGLKQNLPDYMLPAVFVKLETMPLTPNGKIDRRALPDPSLDRSQSAVEYVAPRNPVEEKLAGIVGALLHIEKVGVYDNFFELGGHSLLATQFMSRIRQAFDIELPLLTLFEQPTVAELADAVEIAKASGIKAKPQIKKIERAGRPATRRPSRRSRE